jgi:prolipoprotein diacylglyceryltransferase
MVMLLLMKRISMWKKKAKVILLVAVTITVAISGRLWKIIMDNMNYFLVILDLKSQQ